MHGGSPWSLVLGPWSWRGETIAAGGERVPVRRFSPPRHQGTKKTFFTTKEEKTQRRPLGALVMNQENSPVERRNESRPPSVPILSAAAILGNTTPMRTWPTVLLALVLSAPAWAQAPT